jgi:uncharacterized protein involved in exopolysaccharide biosynthesis
MQKLTPQRRLAALAASTAAIAASLPILLHNSDTRIPYTALGMVAGVFVGIAVVLLMRSRRSC